MIEDARPEWIEAGGNVLLQAMLAKANELPVIGMSPETIAYAQAASLPFLFSALRVGIAAGLVGAIVGELPTGAQAGLGARPLTGSCCGNTLQNWSARVMSALLGLVLSGGLAFAERALAQGAGDEPGMADPLAEPTADPVAVCARLDRAARDLLAWQCVVGPGWTPPSRSLRGRECNGKLRKFSKQFLVDRHQRRVECHREGNELAVAGRAMAVAHPREHRD